MRTANPINEYSWLSITIHTKVANLNMNDLLFTKFVNKNYTALLILYEFRML